jgi:D-xylono/L-arabinono-1,4-lactonase
MEQDAAPEILVNKQCIVGEGPLWHPAEQCLYWTDIDGKKLYRYFPDTKQTELCFEGEIIGGFTLQADGALLLFGAAGSVSIWRNGKIERRVIQEIPRERKIRFNDVIADPEGRVFCGTIGDVEKPEGALYCLNRDGSYQMIWEGIYISNGMGFSPDEKLMYYIDSQRQQVFVYDYDRASGDVSNRRVLIDYNPEKPYPDGMTVDAQGDLWIAMAMGGCVKQYDAGGREKKSCKMPMRMVTSVAFGGKNLDELYITSGTELGDLEWNMELAGATMRLNPGVRGKPEYFSRIVI